MNRDENIHTLRPQIEIALNGKKDELEVFMHRSLRPILKLQHPIICQLISSEKHLKKDQVQQNDKLLRHQYLSTFLQKNTTLRNTLIGVVIGCFMTEELEFYLQEKKPITKRIIEMIVVRYLSTH